MLLIDGIDDTLISCYAFPNGIRFTLPSVDASGELMHSMIYRVPVDDALTQMYFLRFYPTDIHSFHIARRDTRLGEFIPLAGDWWGVDMNDPDRMAVEQQGVIADREDEHLGVSDGGIIGEQAGQEIVFPQPSSRMEEKQKEAEYARDLAGAN